MKTFREYFEDMESRSERIALLPGGFKPPTKGHFSALRYLVSLKISIVVMISLFTLIKILFSMAITFLEQMEKTKKKHNINFNRSIFFILVRYALSDGCNRD